MRKPVIFITGANGEIGHGLITQLTGSGGRQIVTLDLAPLDPDSAAAGAARVHRLDPRCGLLERILSEFEVDLVFHLAALLSTRSEFTPIRAHEVNVQGTLMLLEFAQKEAESHGRPVTFLYPSSIAAYGLPDLATKRAPASVSEDEYNHPTTMYGANKLYCELLGNYYARHYKQLAAETLSGKVDFRCVRFPGPHLRDDGAVWRHVRLRARDDPRGRARRAATRASCGPTRGSRSWRCPMASRRCSGSPGAAGSADAHGVQRHRVQPVRRRDSRRRRRARSRGAAITYRGR